MDADVSVAGVANVLICREEVDELAYQIIKVLLEKSPTWWPSIKRQNFTAGHGRVSIPFHPGP